MSDGVTHVICGGSQSAAEVRKLEAEASPKKLKVIDAEWVYRCGVEKALINPQPYYVINNVK